MYLRSDGIIFRSRFCSPFAVATTEGELLPFEEFKRILKLHSEDPAEPLLALQCTTMRPLKDHCLPLWMYAILDDRPLVAALTVSWPHAFPPYSLF